MEALLPSATSTRNGTIWSTVQTPSSWPLRNTKARRRMKIIWDHLRNWAALNQWPFSTFWFIWFWCFRPWTLWTVGEPNELKFVCLPAARVNTEPEGTGLPVVYSLFCFQQELRWSMNGTADDFEQLRAFHLEEAIIEVCTVVHCPLLSLVWRFCMILRLCWDKQMRKQVSMESGQGILENRWMRKKVPPLERFERLKRYEKVYDLSVSWVAKWPRCHLRIASPWIGSHVPSSWRHLRHLRHLWHLWHRYWWIRIESMKLSGKRSGVTAKCSKHFQTKFSSKTFELRTNV